MDKTIDDFLYEYFLNTDVGKRCILFQKDMISHMMYIDKKDSLYYDLGIRQVDWFSKGVYTIYADLRFLSNFTYYDFSEFSLPTIIIKWRGPNFSKSKRENYNHNLRYQGENMMIHVDLEDYYFDSPSPLIIKTKEALKSVIESNVKIENDSINEITLRLFDIDNVVLYSHDYILEGLYLIDKLCETKCKIKSEDIVILIGSSFMSYLQNVDITKLKEDYLSLKKRRFRSSQQFSTKKISYLSRFTNSKQNIEFCKSFMNMCKSVLGDVK